MRVPACLRPALSRLGCSKPAMQGTAAMALMVLSGCPAEVLRAPAPPGSDVRSAAALPDSASRQPPASGPAPAKPAVPVAVHRAGWTLRAANVGLAASGTACDRLPPYTGAWEIPAGSVITGRRFITPISLYQGNIVIEHCCFQPTTAGRGMPIVTTTNYDGNFEPGRGKVIIRDSEFDGSLLAPESAAYATAFIGIADLLRNYVHNFGSGLALYNTGSQLDVLVENNVVTQLLPQDTRLRSTHHSDAFTIRDFSIHERPDRLAIIRANRFDCDSMNCTGAVFIQPWHGRISNVRIEANLLEGRGWNLGLEQNKHGYSNVSAINNRFTPRQHGAVYTDGGEGWHLWQSNHIFDSSRRGGQGAAL